MGREQRRENIGDGDHPGDGKHLDALIVGAGFAGLYMPYPGFPPYVEKCNQVAASGYDGFALT